MPTVKNGEDTLTDSAAAVSLQQVTYGPPLWRPIALLVAALAAGAAALLVLPLWALAAVLLVAAARDWWCRPALVLDGEGFTYVTGLHREFASWSLLHAIRVRQERHFLAFGKHLEIDLSDETLIVLSKAQLAVEPDEVAAVLQAAWRQAVRSDWQS